MGKFYKPVLFVLFSFFYVVQQSSAQELSTQGKNFWLTFIENFGGTGGCGDNSTPQLKIVISCNKATSGTVKNPVTNVSMPFSIGTGGGIDTVLVPTFIGYLTGSEGTSQRNRGLYIEANDTVAVSAQNTKNFSCDATLVYPVEAMGVDYRILSHMGDQSGNSTCYKSCFAIIATENSTTIDITPSCATTGGNPANTMFTITLQKGETYLVKANTHRLDLSGTLVQARDCKKIAVFGGATRASVLYGANNSCGASYDHLWEQMMPINMWGKKFICIPTLYAKNKQRRAEMIRVVASLNSTTVRCNGKLKVLSAGQCDTFFLTTNAIINANKPIGLCQYALTEDCDKVNGGSDTDPMMMWVAPIEQSLKTLNFSCENALQINKFFLNVIVKTSYRNSFKLDGAAPTATWNLVTKDTSYSYLQQDGLTQGKHNIYSPIGFSALLYAYGDHGSYGYNAGSSVKALSFYSIVNGKSSADFESDSLFYSICQNATVPFDGGGSNISGVTWKWIIKDKSTTVVKSTKSFSHIFKDTGIFPVTMIAQRPTNGTCNGQTTIDDTIKSEVRVYKKPDIRLMKDTTICLGNSFTIKSTTDGDTTYTFSPATWLSCTKCFEPVSKPLLDTAYYVTSTYKGCTPSRDTMKVFVRDSFFLSVSNDTTICRGTSASINAFAKGGLASAHTVTWDQGLGTGFSKTVNPKITTTYRAILTDGCTRDNNGNLYADTSFIKVTVLDSLKITMPKDTIVCEGNDVTLNVIVKGGLSSSSVVNWDNNLGSGLSKTVTLGNIDVTYKAVLSDGCTNPQDSGYVTIKVRPGINIDTIIYNNPVCRNQTFQIKMKASGGDSTGFRFRLFDISSGSFVLVDSIKGTAEPVFTRKISDDSKYSVSMNQSCNSQQNGKKFNIAIKTGLSLQNPIAADTICTGSDYILDINGSSADQLPINFVLKRKNGLNWLPVDSIIHGSKATFTIKQTMATADYMITGDDKCSRTDSVYFRLLLRLPLTITALTDDELCRNESKTLTANISGGKVQAYNYRWFENVSNNTLGTNKTLNYTPSESIDISVEADDGCSAPVTSGARLWVAPIVTDSVIAILTQGCEPLSTVFTYPLTLAQPALNTPFTWKWYFDANNAPNQVSAGGQTHADIPKTYITPGNYNAHVDMVLANNKICFSTDQEINVYKNAIADFDYLPKQVDVVEPEVSFTNQSTGATKYKWVFSDGTIDSTENPKHIFTDTGWYNITLYASNINGCNDTISGGLRVLDIFRIFIPGAFSPNQDDFNTTWSPQFTSLFTCEVTIFNRWGQQVYFSKDNTGSWDGKFNNIDCEMGVYYYHLKVKDNRKKWHYYNGTLTLMR